MQMEMKMREANAASGSAGDLLAEVIGFAGDPRADTTMAAGYALMRIAESGGTPGHPIERDALLAAAPGLCEDRYWDVVEAAADGRGLFSIGHLMAALELLRSPLDAAIVVGLLHHDLSADGKRRWALTLDDAVMGRMAAHMRRH